jgi:hypothetical protein
MSGAIYTSAPLACLDGMEKEHLYLFLKSTTVVR